MMQNKLLHGLSTCLQREIQMSVQLLETLRREHKALTTNNLVLLNETVAQKGEQIAAMDDCSRERNALLHEAGFGTDRTALEKLLDLYDPQRRTPVQREWTRLLEIGAECQRQNLVNGIIIQAGQQHTRQALAILRGQPAVTTGEYGPEGGRHSTASSHPLAKA